MPRMDEQQMRPWGGDTPEHDGFQTGNCAYNEISVMRVESPRRVAAE